MQLERLRTRVVYPPGAGELAQLVIRKTALLRPRIQDRFSVDLGRLRIELVRGHEALQGLTRHTVPTWALAIAVSDRGLIGIRIDLIERLRNNLAATLKHELMHVALARIESRAGARLPRWFNEGVCEWYSGAMHHQGRRSLALDAARGQLIPLSQLDNAFPEQADAAAQAYLQSHSIVSYLAVQYPGAIEETVRRCASGEPMPAALERATERDLATLEADWRESITPEHPWLYLLWNALTLFGAIGLLVVFAYGVRKLRDQRTLAAWDDEEPWMTHDIDYTNWRGDEDP